MKAFSSLPLDDDLVDRVLMYLPNFETLQAAILSSKAMHAVFAAHPNSIVEAVAFNVVGDAMPSALNLIRYQPPDDPSPFGHTTAEPTEVRIITPEDARKLSQNAFVVDKFQDNFSHRHKDRSSERSTLTSAESLRFTRAMYRIMLYQAVFPGATTPYIDDADTEEEAQIHAARKAFFTMFSTSELREIHTVTNFMKSLGRSLARKVGDYRGGMYNSECEHANAVPAALFLRAYQERNPWLLDEHFEDFAWVEENHLILNYFERPIREVWQDRKEQDLTSNDFRGGYILDESKEEGDAYSSSSSSSSRDP